MKIEFTTTIVHTIILNDDGIEDIQHSVAVDAGEAIVFGVDGLMKIAKAGCTAAVNTLESGRKPDIVLAEPM